MENGTPAKESSFYLPASIFVFVFGDQHRRWW